MSAFNAAVKRCLRHLGMDVQRAANTLPAIRSQVFRRCNTNIVLDVGANNGQYALEIRENGYAGRIISFEPSTAAYTRLVAKSRTVPLWETRNIALGDTNEMRTFNISANSVSSSLLQISEESVAVNEATAKVATEDVQVRRLDDEIPFESLSSRVHLKIDTQGFELEVLRGAINALGRCTSIECELSLVEVYHSQPLLPEVCGFLYNCGFHATWFERGFQNKQGDCLQLDALFLRNDTP